jgi:hypothetical protein
VTCGVPSGLAAAEALVALAELAAAEALVALAELAAAEALGAPARRGSLLLKPRSTQVRQRKSDGASTRVPTVMMIPSITAKLTVLGHE